MYKNLLRLKLEGVNPLSTNNSNWCFYNPKVKKSIKVPSEALKSYKKFFRDNVFTDHYLERVRNKISKMGKIEALSLSVIYEGQVYNANGSVRKFDITNVVKPLEDIINSSIDIDDKYNFESYQKKINNSEQTILYISLDVIIDSEYLTYNPIKDLFKF